MTILRLQTILGYELSLLGDRNIATNIGGDWDICNTIFMGGRTSLCDDETFIADFFNNNEAILLFDELYKIPQFMCRLLLQKDKWYLQKYEHVSRDICNIKIVRDAQEFHFEKVAKIESGDYLFFPPKKIQYHILIQ